MHLTNHIQTIKGQELKCASLLSFHTTFPRLSTSDFFSCPYKRSHTLFHLRVRAALWNPWKVQTSVRERKKEKTKKMTAFQNIPFQCLMWKKSKSTTWACGPVLLVIFSLKVTSCRLHCFLTVPCVSGLSAAATAVGKIHLLYFFSLLHIYVRIC